MAYVRERGNQLAIVHGERDPKTKKVRQRVLFTIYSLPEARELLGEGEGDAGGRRRFESLLEGQYPELRFDWEKIHQAVREKLGVLPDSYEYQAERLNGHFRDDLCKFTRQLVLADPQWLFSSAQLVRSQRYELAFLRDLIDWRLQTCEQKETDWNRDDPFHWRFALTRREVPGEVEEMAVRHYEERRLEEARALFRLLIECFDGYAEGYNYLGLIALDCEELEEATAHFERTVELGQRKFSRRIAREDYWNLLETRPYVRGLRNLALCLNRAGRYDEALTICDRLERECADDITANARRASVYLNTGRWEEAAGTAGGLSHLYPTESLVAGLAAFEVGQRDEAAWRCLHATMNTPRAVRMFFGLQVAKLDPSARTGPAEIDDHNAGVHLRRDLHGFLAEQSPKSKRFFRKVLRDPAVAALLAEKQQATERWVGPRDSGGEWRAAFDRLQLMKSPEFAREQAESLFAPALGTRSKSGSTRRR